MTDLITGGLDIESTGFLTPDHRIVEIYIGLYRNGAKFWEYDQRIDPQRSMPAEAQRVHGISSTDLIGKPTWDIIGPKVYKILSKCDDYVWHNGDDFDGPFIDMELKRIGLPGIPERKALDTMQQGVWATHDGKKPRLEELCFALGIPYEQSLAHAASYDVDVMMQCAIKGTALGFFEVSQPLEAAQAA